MTPIKGLVTSPRPEAWEGVDSMVDLVYGCAPEGTLKGDRNAIMKKNIRELLSRRNEELENAIMDKSFFSLTGYKESAERIVRISDVLSILKRGKG